MTNEIVVAGEVWIHGKTEKLVYVVCVAHIKNKKQHFPSTKDNFIVSYLSDEVYSEWLQVGGVMPRCQCLPLSYFTMVYSKRKEDTK